MLAVLGGSPTIKEKLFQPSFTAKPTGKGAGLGLSTSWDIVPQQLGSTIEVESQVGRFAEFTMRCRAVLHRAGSERGVRARMDVSALIRVWPPEVGF